MEYIVDLLVESGLLVVQLFGLSIAFAYILTAISGSLKGSISRVFGRKGQLIFGFLGIIIHEFGHFIFALIFSHKVNKVSLLNVRPDDEDDNSLGSVSHSYNRHNLFHSVGNYFIGIAPIFTCTFSIGGLYLLFFRESIPLFKENIKLLLEDQNIKLFIGNVLETLKVVDYPLLKTALFVIIITNIVIGGFDLSKSDFKGIYAGIIPIFITSLLFTIVIRVFFKGLILTNIIIGLNVTLGLILGTSVLLGLITLIVMKILMSVIR